MKLTTDYIRRIAKRDHRIDEIEICPDHQVTVWLDPKWTWNALDGNITCMTYNVQGADDYCRDDVATFLDHVHNIEEVK
ncbi:hypothetical protein UFOVP122_21 [uncultured Caudovirales phage]|uniref:Phage protein n=1 Tax=uncultured Caudovirales phage TaxID=2100421 RepID=A0A6J5L9R6_9CAUD|nr:hypothetical protein UFOVP122_21 [uncultured Caudovirales phage]